MRTSKFSKYQDEERQMLDELVDELEKGTGGSGG
jgi:uncharacterized protein YejL (UPF0352 family)